MARNIPNFSRPAITMLECLVYLALALLVAQGVFTFAVQYIRTAYALRQTVLAECAVHNALVIFKREADLFPAQLARYRELTSTRIAYDLAQGGWCAWYFDEHRFMRAEHHGAHRVDYSVVLEPADGHFTIHTLHDRLVSLTLTLSHNGKTLEQLFIVHGT